jgi:hypothetical protein
MIPDIIEMKTINVIIPNYVHIHIKNIILYRGYTLIKVGTFRICGGALRRPTRITSYPFRVLTIYMVRRRRKRTPVPGGIYHHPSVDFYIRRTIMSKVNGMLKWIEIRWGEGI